MYEKLIMHYKDKEYLPSYFEKSLMHAWKKYNEFYAHRNIDQNSDNISTWD